MDWTSVLQRFPSRCIILVLVFVFPPYNDFAGFPPCNDFAGLPPCDVFCWASDVNNVFVVASAVQCFFVVTSATQCFLVGFPPCNSLFVGLPTCIFPRWAPAVQCCFFVVVSAVQYFLVGLPPGNSLCCGSRRAIFSAADFYTNLFDAYPIHIPFCWSTPRILCFVLLDIVALPYGEAPV